MRRSLSSIQKIRWIVLTGGPGAGKTAVLELAHRMLCSHVEVLPEAASIVFKGGFPRRNSVHAQQATQRAIFQIQSELENTILEREDHLHVVLCDRGTIDGLAYWPGLHDDFWAQTQTTLEQELSLYHKVIHLHTPSLNHGYQKNNIRTESNSEAELIDTRLVDVWSQHPQRFIVNSTTNFFEKAQHAMELIFNELPEECRAKSCHKVVSYSS